MFQDTSWPDTCRHLASSVLWNFPLEVKEKRKAVRVRRCVLGSTVDICAGDMFKTERDDFTSLSNSGSQVPRCLSYVLCKRYFTLAEGQIRWGSTFQNFQGNCRTPFQVKFLKTHGWRRQRERLGILLSSFLSS